MSHPGFITKKVQIRFADCDPFGHLNNARYLDYFMHAREDHLREKLDFSIAEWMEETGFAWVVKEHRIQYLRPVKSNEWVWISSAIIHQTEMENIVEFGIWDETHKKLKSLMWSNFQYIDMKTMRPARYQEGVLTKFMPMVIEDSLPPFEGRAMEMQKRFRVL